MLWRLKEGDFQIAHFPRRRLVNRRSLVAKILTGAEVAVAGIAQARNDVAAIV
jgi:hypothetical protein